MFNVGLIQPNFQTGPKHLNSYYLPYTVGALWAYVSQFKEIHDNFQVTDWLFSRQPITSVVEQYNDIDVVFISLYIWNKNYCIQLAKQLKLAYPNIIIIMGGPETPWRDRRWHEDNDYIDTLVIGEGELALKEICINILKNIPLEKTYKFDRMKELDLPSPYTLGLFDSLIDKHPEIEWVPTLETDRGCPYACTFCDWGSATASKMYKLYDERIDNDIQWMIDNKLPYMSLTNSNFGIFKERDMLITDKIVNANKATGYPSGISVSYAKNSNKTVLEIVKKFLDVNIQTGLVLSLQTTSEDVLGNIKRKNMKINSIEDIVAMCDEKNVPVLTELILGMPGETKQSWLSTLDDILENKISILDTYFLQLLINSPMYVSQMEEYGLETFEGYDFFYGIDSSEFKADLQFDVSESIEVIKSTNTLPEKEMEEVSVFTAFVMGFHIFGFTNILSNYLYEKKNIKYMKFYSDLYNYMLTSDSMMEEIIDDMTRGLQLWKKKGYMDATIKGVQTEGWKFFHAIPAVIQHNNLVNHYFDMIIEFSKQYNIDSNTLNDIKQVSTLQVKQYEHPLHSPQKVKITSDLYPCDVVVSDRYNDFPETKNAHIEMLFFGRRRAWHLNKIDLDK